MVLKSPGGGLQSARGSVYRVCLSAGQVIKTRFENGCMGRGFPLCPMGCPPPKHVTIKKETAPHGADASQPSTAVGCIQSKTSCCDLAVFSDYSASKHALYVLLVARMLCSVGVGLFMLVPRDVSSAYQAQEITANNNNISLEMVQAAKTVHVFGAEDQQMGHYWDQVDELVKLRTRNNWILAGSSILSTAVPYGFSIVMFGYSGYLAQIGLLDITQLLTVAAYQSTLSSHFQVPGPSNE